MKPSTRLAVVATLAACAFAKAAGAQLESAKPAPRLASARFAFQPDPNGIESVLVLDATGATERAIALDVDVPVFGPGDRLLLVSRAERDGVQTVRVVAASGLDAARFEAPAGSDFTLGASSIALSTRHDHTRGAPMHLAFLSLQGAPLGAHDEPALTLAMVDAAADGGFVAWSVDARGRFVVHHFSALGQLSWRLALPGESRPVVALAPDGAHALVGWDASEYGASRWRLIDAKGGPIATGTIAAFTAAAFSVDGRFAACAGDDAVAILDVAAGAVAFRDESPFRLALGESIAFEAQRGDCCVLGTHGARTFRGPSWSELPARALPDAALAAPVVAFAVAADGALAIATADRVVAVKP